MFYIHYSKILMITVQLCVVRDQIAPHFQFADMHISIHLLSILH